MHIVTAFAAIDQAEWRGLIIELCKNGNRVMRANYTDAQFEPETLISTHMDLVRRIAWHLHGRVHSAIEIDDLLQIGYVGLITKGSDM